jgi:cob(I)alamin adenosyltransferase
MKASRAQEITRAIERAKVREVERRVDGMERTRLDNDSRDTLRYLYKLSTFL